MVGRAVFKKMRWLLCSRVKDVSHEQDPGVDHRSVLSHLAALTLLLERIQSKKQSKSVVSTPGLEV